MVINEIYIDFNGVQTTRQVEVPDNWYCAQSDSEASEEQKDN